MKIYLSPPINNRDTGRFGIIYRNGKVYRNTINTSTNQHLAMDLIRTNHARVMYYLPPCTPIVEE